MEKTNFIVNRKIVLVFAILNLICTSMGIYARMKHLEIPNIVVHIGWGIAFFAWFVVMGDILANKIYRKTFWVVSMFIFPSLSPLFYVIQRNKLINIAAKKEFFSSRS
ncbi:MAG TPA: hypothetical protein VFM70_06065 [Salinimicrobium sp.]|nr:hypothetical protein [Salinimicrobium sp.]